MSKSPPYAALSGLAFGLCHLSATLRTTPAGLYTKAHLLIPLRKALTIRTTNLANPRTDTTDHWMQRGELRNMKSALVMQTCAQSCSTRM